MIETREFIREIEFKAKVIKRLETSTNLSGSECYRLYPDNPYHWCCTCLNGEGPCMRGIHR